MTYDPERLEVEEAAAAISRELGGAAYNMLPEADREDYRRAARAALACAPECEYAEFGL